MGRVTRNGIALELSLNPNLDPQELAKVYRQNAGWVRVEDIFPPKTAAYIESVLKTQTPWYFVHSDETGEHKYYSRQELGSMAASDRNAIIDGTLKRASEGFAYLYNTFPMIDFYLSGQESNWPLRSMSEFLNSQEVQKFVKMITNEPSVVKLDAQATCYSPGHFLNTHDDTGANAERQVAYVMGFTQDWRVDWGGQTLFLDTNGNTLRGLSPSFNTLTLFKVPRPHIVTQVSTFAPRSRYSITGWLRTDL